LLNFEQKQNHKNVAQQMLAEATYDSEILKAIITCDETWVYGYDIETKVQPSQ